MLTRDAARDAGLVVAAALVAWTSTSYRAQLTEGDVGRILQQVEDASSGDGQEASAGVWVLAVLASVLTKLTSSIDDVVWLLPFVAGSHRTTNMWRAAQYVATMVGVAGAACAVAVAGDQAIEALVDEDSEWSSQVALPARHTRAHALSASSVSEPYRLRRRQRVLSLAAGAMLSLYSIKLFREWLAERREAREEAREEPAAASTATVELQVVSDAQEPAGARDKEAPSCDKDSTPAPAATTDAPTDDPTDAPTDAPIDAPAAPPAPAAPASTARRLLVVSLMGSVDDFAVFVSLMLARTFSAPQLLLGVGVGSVLVTSFCLFASLFEPVVRAISLVPLFAIISAFAAYTFVEAFA